MGITWHTTASDMLKNMGNEWWTIYLLVAVIIVLFNALVYMASRIFILPQIERYAKGELLQAFAMIAIGGILLAFQVSGDFAMVPGGRSVTQLIDEKVAEQILGMKGYAANPYEVDYVYLAAILKKLETEFMDANSQSSLDIPLTMMFGITIMSNYIPIPLQTAFEFIWSMLFDAILIAEDTMWLSIATYFQLNLLQWIEASMAAVYLPLGLIFRAIPITRGLGAAMMGVAITLYFIYPFVLAILFLSGPPIEGITISVEEKPQQAGGSVAKPKVCPADPTAVLELLNNPQFKPDSPQGQARSEKLSNTISAFSLIQLYAYFYPVVAMFTCLLAANAITSVLGGDLSGISRSIFRVV